MTNILALSSKPEEIRKFTNLQVVGMSFVAMNIGQLNYDTIPHYDLVIVVEDLDFVKLLRKRHPTEKIAIIALGGEMVASLDAGADNWLSLEFDTEVLLALIRALIRRVNP